MTTVSDLHPPLGLRIVAGPLELRGITDDDLPALCDLAMAGIHPPEQMPFAFPWTDAPAADLPGLTAQYHWRVRAAFAPAAWSLQLGVWHRGILVGVQGIETENYLVTWTGETGSWLGRTHQGQGVGTAMRQAICAFAFDHLGAQELTSGAFVDNPASLAVSRKVGYRDNGSGRKVRRPGELAMHQSLVLGPGDLVRGEPIEVHGVAALRRAIGLDDPGASPIP